MNPPGGGLRNDRFAGRTVLPGDTAQVRLKVSETVTHQPLRIPVVVSRGPEPGPTLFLTSAVHGDEINGVAIVRRVLDRVQDKIVRGTLIAVPVVNRFGFEAQNRYLPDRRDLNRHFPGDGDGSMASRIAKAVFEKVVMVSDAGIDLHTAATGNSNLCHIRGDAERPDVKDIMRAFGTPVMMHSDGPRGSLRREATRRGVPTILFEAGEPGRFQGHVVEIGQTGVLNVMARLGMLKRRVRRPGFQTLLRRSEWVRANHGGIVDMRAEPGDLVRKNHELGTIHDPFGRDVQKFRAPRAGVVVGTTTTPLTNPGQALVHIGQLQKTWQKARDYVREGGDLGHVNWSEQAR